MVYARTMKRAFAWVAFIALILIAGAKAAEKTPVTLVISQKVVRREPIGPTLQNSDRFRLLNNKLYAWVRLNERVSGSHIHHVWYYQDKLMDDIRMPVAQLGRMYSVKTIGRQYIGVWRVEVVREDRTMLESRYFSVDLIDNELYATVMERARN